MSETYFDFRPKVPHDLTQVAQAANRLQPGDEVRVVLERYDAHQADPLLDLLRDRGLQVTTRGGHGEEFWIIGFARPKDESRPEEEEDPLPGSSPGKLFSGPEP